MAEPHAVGWDPRPSILGGGTPTPEMNFVTDTLLLTLVVNLILLTFCLATYFPLTSRVETQKMPLWAY